MKHRAATFLTVAVAVSSIWAAIPKENRTSDRFGYSTFLEDAGRVTILADGYPASVAPKSGYVPVPVAVAVTQPGRRVVFRPESFTLVDADGHAVPAASFEEITTKYGRRNHDRSLARLRPIAVPETIGALLQVPSAFYPPVNGGTRIPEVELSSGTWFQDILYFPVPPSGLHGVLTLRVTIQGEPTVDVRFVATEKELSGANG
ncbi:MAG TPA: hypothetical protein VFV19_08725 [Candidatus Polarisedimenticolaceae bacterium]|nr:hypothetical protein [Candidatus Polarisedimenticolaceae bacterium]